MSKGDEARQLFMQGFNCSQAVAAVFADEMGMPIEQVERLTIGFGGGLARMREVCGTVSGMAFVISALYDGDKASIYARIQEVAGEFKEQNSSIVCHELLGMGKKPAATSPIPEERTPEYYKKRPCVELVQMAADILERYIAENKN